MTLEQGLVSHISKLSAMSTIYRSMGRKRVKPSWPFTEDKLSLPTSQQDNHKHMCWCTLKIPGGIQESATVVRFNVKLHGRSVCNDNKLASMLAEGLKATVPGWREAMPFTECTWGLYSRRTSRPSGVEAHKRCFRNLMVQSTCARWVLWFRKRALTSRYAHMLLASIQSVRPKQYHLSTVCVRYDIEQSTTHPNMLYVSGMQYSS